MSARVERRLERALCRSACAAGVEVTIVAHEWTDWACGLFVGKTHGVRLIAPADAALETWLNELAEALLPVPGSVVADLLVEDRRAVDGIAGVALSVLTIEA